ncbi:alpha-glucan family phosphorylase [Mucisphaera calidilacus]|uniref:glycogen phosphorylase n=1 Tax=Mucisphaera calidilacus TaxID=2527982 RepID=A0A518BVF5_9BACT|nr:alpha-glucan family phosphorylase [Mucisphaera calidilacus]QDU70958.1 Maltodextrin phosphorylase [Mucisphaera calidilacus]
MLKANSAKIRHFQVEPSLPEALKPLIDIANNLWWTWNYDAVELFVRLDQNLWTQTKHNPVKLLGMVSQDKLESAARDEGFLGQLQQVHQQLKTHVSRAPWMPDGQKDPNEYSICYFCSEFGMTESLQIYSGGLGLLAGDHLKSASELGIPLLAVGLLYRYGYFQQYLSSDGWQQETDPKLDFSQLPVHQVKDASGEQVKVSVRLPGRDVKIALWKVKVGKVDLYLLDTNLPENNTEDRTITGQLYGGDMEMRIKQEIVLGIGGVRALEAIGIRPDVCHMNEGHSAFLGLERIRRLIEDNDLAFDEARQAAAASHCFTTHTPVPAGIDRFPPEMIKRYFKDYHESLRLDMEGLLALGRENVGDKGEFFSMAVLAIRTADWCNGVSKLHGEVSRGMWQNVWPDVPTGEVPIGHVTNGVHARSWLDPQLVRLFDRYLGTPWREDQADKDVWRGIAEIPDEDLWRVHEDARQKLVVWAKRKLRTQMERQGKSPEMIRNHCEALSDDALTVGFARRFATYKRGTLLLRDMKRLERLLESEQRPIQFLIAGKAHPADGGGKALIRELVQFSNESKLGHRIVFLEDYDIGVARYLVQGCDIWLNTPRRGMEASGTSGMKAAMNGVLNCSILDGWWDEAYEPDLGWAIGRREEYANPEQGDDIESRALYDLLENQIIPLFYQRDDQGMPREWVARMKQCIGRLAPAFNTNRMVQDYTRKYYLPAARRAATMAADGLKNSVDMAHVKHRLHEHWDGIKILNINAQLDKPLELRQTLDVTAEINLAKLEPSEVRVQIFAGTIDNDGDMVGGSTIDMRHEKDLGGGKHKFVGVIEPTTSGRYGFAVRVIPGAELLDGFWEPGLICWDAPERPVAPVVEEKVEEKKVVASSAS